MVSIADNTLAVKLYVSVILILLKPYSTSIMNTIDKNNELYTNINVLFNPQIAYNQNLMYS